MVVVDDDMMMMMMMMMMVMMMMSFLAAHDVPDRLLGVDELRLPEATGPVDRTLHPTQQLPRLRHRGQQDYANPARDYAKLARDYATSEGITRDMLGLR
jgi:hypothetical protein